MEFVGVTYQAVDLAGGKRMQITVPSAPSMTYAVYNNVGSELLLTDVQSIKFPFEFGYNWFQSSKVLELTLPPYTPLDFEYYTNAGDYTSETPI